jgi:hypothetical protein
VTRIHADIDALKEFHGALSRFRYAQRDLADRVDDEIELARAALEAKASRCQSLLERYRAELAECRDRDASADNPEDCSGCERSVSEAAENLERIRLWQYRIDAEAGQFRAISSQFRGLLDDDVPRAEGELLAAIASLQDTRRMTS